VRAGPFGVSTSPLADISIANLIRRCGFIGTNRSSKAIEPTESILPRNPAVSRGGSDNLGSFWHFDGAERRVLK
jgi:hypothetical protein